MSVGLVQITTASSVAAAIAVALPETRVVGLTEDDTGAVTDDGVRCRRRGTWSIFTPARVPRWQRMARRSVVVRMN